MFNGVWRSSKPIAGESLTPIGQNSLLHLEISFDYKKGKEKNFKKINNRNEKNR